MTEPTWLDRVECIALYEEILTRFGGLAGIRDEGLLESALHRPRKAFAYEEADLFALAATYAAGIIGNHPFHDGNKRIGFVVAAVFLEVNGESFAAPEEEVVERTMALAAGAIPEGEYAAWLRRSCGKTKEGKEK